MYIHKIHIQIQVYFSSLSIKISPSHYILAADSNEIDIGSAFYSGSWRKGISSHTFFFHWLCGTLVNHIRYIPLMCGWRWKLRISTYIHVLSYCMNEEDARLCFALPTSQHLIPTIISKVILWRRRVSDRKKRILVSQRKEIMEIIEETIYEKSFQNKE